MLPGESGGQSGLQRQSRVDRAGGTGLEHVVSSNINKDHSGPRESSGSSSEGWEGPENLHFSKCWGSRCCLSSGPWCGSLPTVVRSLGLL